MFSKLFDFIVKNASSARHPGEDIANKIFDLWPRYQNNDRLVCLASSYYWSDFSKLIKLINALSDAETLSLLTLMASNFPMKTKKEGIRNMRSEFVWNVIFLVMGQRSSITRDIFAKYSELLEIYCYHRGDAMQHTHNHPFEYPIEIKNRAGQGQVLGMLSRSVLLISRPENALYCYIIAAKRFQALDQANDDDFRLIRQLAPHTLPPYFASDKNKIDHVEAKKLMDDFLDPPENRAPFCLENGKAIQLMLHPKADLDDVSFLAFMDKLDESLEGARARSNDREKRNEIWYRDCPDHLARPQRVELYHKAVDNYIFWDGPLPKEEERRILDLSGQDSWPSNCGMQVSRDFKGQIVTIKRLSRKQRLQRFECLGEAPLSVHAWNDQRPPRPDLLHFDQLERPWGLAELLSKATASKPTKKWVKDCKHLIKVAGQERVHAQILDWLSLMLSDLQNKRALLDFSGGWFLSYQMACYQHCRKAGFGDESLLRPWIKLAHQESNGAYRNDFPLLIETETDVEAYIRLRFRGDPLILSDANAILARGIVWALCVLDEMGHRTPPDFLEALAIANLKSSQLFANACIFTLSELQSPKAVMALARICRATRDNRLIKQINKALTNVAERSGIAKEDLEEISIPNFGMTAPVWEESLEDGGQLRLEITAYKADIHYISIKGRPLKSVPKAARATELYKQMNAVRKEAGAILPIIRQRLDASYLQKRVWQACDWKDRYIDHPVCAAIAQCLIWWVITDNVMTSAIWREDGMVDVEGKSVTLSGATIRLWHPVEDSADNVQAWRNHVTSHKIVQPFKQAHREVYVLTDAERQTSTFSNRFAAHILKQHQYMALAKQNRWKASHRMYFDVPNDEPTWIDLPAFDMWAEFFIQPPRIEGPHEPETLESGAFVYVTTDQVRFYRKEQVLQLEDVPPILFSEIMRHCDLIVGVSSIGNDPNWINRGTDADRPSLWDQQSDAYWHRISFGELAESAKTRRELLASLLPSLAIANQCHIEDRYLVVQGKLKTYRIHFNSGSVMMMPDETYLCIVPKSRSQSYSDSLYIPFEGDATFSIILSKAVILANDDKIQDPSIKRQIIGN